MIKDDYGGVWLDWPHVITLFGDDGNERDYLPERTCRDVAGYTRFECSACGFRGLVVDSATLGYVASYCPNCGAKVVR